MLLSPGCYQSIPRLLGNRILNAVAGLFRTGLDTFSGVFGRDLCSMANVLNTGLCAFADFLSSMLNDMTGLGCSFVHILGGILSNRYSYTENQQCGNPCNFQCFHRFSFSFATISFEQHLHAVHPQHASSIFQSSFVR
jgi:hypothetical protein